ncbi:MAG: hypothetical protein KDA47_00210 [Planctomycetales bacterium]|nr:hypothetical protein [Planctomycetales bacterium]
MSTTTPSKTARPFELLRAVTQRPRDANEYLDRMARSLDRIQSILTDDVETQAGPPEDIALRNHADSSIVSSQATTSRRTDSVIYELTDAWAIPILPNGAPDPARGMALQGIMLCDRQVELRGPVAGMSLGSRWLVAGRAEDDVLRFGEVQVVADEQTGESSHIAAYVLPSADCLLRPEILTPKFDHRSGRIVACINPAIAAAWVELGVMERQLIDRVAGCPECDAIVSTRKGCRNCGSVHVDTQPMIHHYACAHVGPAEQFDRGGELCCPKCRAHSLIVGADFEYIQGPLDCRECGWSDSQLEMIAECVHCRLRFPLDQATEQEIVAYHVERLDSLVDDSAA